MANLNIPTKQQVAENPNMLFENAPLCPISDRKIEVQVVGKRCVYVNDYRVAGGKPYYTENLPKYRHSSSLKEIISAFNREDLLAAISENDATREYFAAYHAQQAVEANEAPTHLQENSNG